jgi:hypothetical protein
MPVLPVSLNPLLFTTIDLQRDGSAEPNADQVLDYLSAPNATRTVDAFVQRYREISNAPGELPVAPNEATILEKLIWPLRHAKGSYALANYLGCIALCGFVGEMVALVLWDIAKVPLGDHAMTESEQTDVFGSTFEKLGQERRTKVLHALKLIDVDAKAAFDQLRSIRRRYLHLLSQAHAQLPVDARYAYEAALKLVGVVLGQTFENGKIVLRSDLMAYLVEKGIVRPE